jgi:hypothetical protein
MSKPALSLSLLAGALLLAACGKESPEMKAFAIDDPLRADLAKLETYSVFFGHQSVGKDIMQGLEELTAKAGVGPKPVFYKKGDPVPARPFFAHGPVGENRAPQTKLDRLCQLVDGELAGQVDIAFVKLCYVDIDNRTDVKALVKSYRDAVEGLRARHPGVTFVYVTSPLQVTEGWNSWKSKIKYVARTVAGVKNENIKRNEFNDELRRQVAGRPLFDLALIESTRPDGSRQTFWRDRGQYSLANEYTYDGGHLNEYGRQMIAAKLVGFLASLPVTPRSQAAAAPVATTAPEAAAGSR